MSTIDVMSSASESPAAGPAARGSLADDIRPRAAALPAADPCSQAERARLSNRERLDYRYAHCIEHLYDSRAFEALLRMIEDSEFLADQANHWEGFQAGSRDFESFVLPAAIGCRRRYSGPWPRT